MALRQIRRRADWSGCTRYAGHLGNAKLFMLVRVFACSGPSTFLRSASVCQFIASASSYLLWLCSTNAKLFTVASVSGCSGPSTFSYRVSVYRSIASASLYFPWLFSTLAKFLMLVSVSGCPGPSTSLLCNARRNSLSALAYNP
jgi:hypothetical protein